MNSLASIFLKKICLPAQYAGIDINSKEAIVIHKRIIKGNLLLTRHYEFIYKYFREIENCLAGSTLPSLEIGSGGGFLKEFIPGVVTSDVVAGEGIDRVESATALSFSDNALKAVYANGVLHHINDVEACLKQIQRVLMPGGMFVCNEPSTNFFGYFMNKYFHNEPTDKFRRGWKLAAGDESKRLSDANMAMPYIIFKRDRLLFQRKFVNLKIRSVVYHDFLRYAFSGGLSYQPFVPRILYGLVNFIEFMVKPLMPVLGSNMIVVIEKAA